MSRIMIPREYDKSMSILESYARDIDLYSKLSDILKRISQDEKLFASYLLYTDGAWFVYVNRTRETIHDKPHTLTVPECDVMRDEFLKELYKLIDEFITQCAFCDTKIYKRYSHTFCGEIACRACIAISKDIVTRDRIETAYRRSISNKDE